MTEFSAGPRSGATMDRQLRLVAVVGLGLLGVLAVNINYIQGSQAEKLQNDALNTRKSGQILLYDRGDILSADGVVLASSDPVGGGNKPKYQRRYAKDGAAFVPVTGFFAGTLQRSGLEIAYDSYLNGTDKSQSVGKWLDQFAGEKPTGANLVTTVDARAQRIAYKRLQISQRRAAAVVIDVRSGAIKVAASFPSFDPNTVADIAKSPADQETLNKLDAQKSKAPLLNKAFGEIFPPGSSFKTVVAAAFLQKGNTKDSPVPAPATLPVPGTRKPISNHGSNGICASAASPLIATFAQSCNTTYAQLGDDDAILGNTAVKEQSERFGFYKPIQIEPDLAAPASQYPHNVQDHGEILRGSFGQGETKATPLQMAMVAAAIGNGGTMMKPYLVEKVRTRKGDVIQEADRKSLGRPISGDTADELQEMMREVVRTGTATNLQGHDIAGKTGTTELTATFGGAWFIGFAPANDPKYGFAVFVEGNTSSFGATTAGPIAAAITDSLLK
ncbi:penicillin-binding protein 2 [Actinocorallia longicatena]|uniref:Penicillin-binding transpeptidase domain-containing protein n=1 Tax=Actinocorallia longicatena TaxID=111803 RepID=A0ABP6QAW2_9ACTN